MPQKFSPGKDIETPLPLLRLSITGVFMGLANLVPGVSGGTMVLALGLYEEFIGAFSDLTRLRFSRRSLIVVAMLMGISAATIGTLAEVIQFLMETFLPGMLALFIGMTLGGVPTLYREMRPIARGNVAFAVAAFVLMGLLAFVFKPDTVDPGWMLLFCGGIIGSSAMILPGISGSYMLLILGLYLPIIAGIADFKDAAKLHDFPALVEIGSTIILPVGLGVLVGLASLTNLLKYLLKQHPRRTVGFLMGLLLGSVLGLYPFHTPTFEKLSRYAVVSEENATKDLRIVAVGWKAEETSPVYRNLKKIETDSLKIKVVDTLDAALETPAMVLDASKREAIIIAYDTKIPRSIRHFSQGKSWPGEDATIKSLEKKVPLLIVPNTEFSPLKAALVLILIVVGFLITFLLGRMGKQHDGDAKTNSAAPPGPSYVEPEYKK